MASQTALPAPLLCVQVALRAEINETTTPRAQVAELPHVVRAISDCLDFKNWTLERACEANKLSLLPRLIAWGISEGVDPYYWRFQCGRGLVAAVKHNNLEMVEWLHDCCPKILPYAAMIEAARLGNLAMLQWLEERHSPPSLPEVTDAAASTNQLEIVEWLLARGYGYTQEALGSAMAAGYFELVVLLVERNLIDSDSICFDDEWFSSGDTRIPQIIVDSDEYKDYDLYRIDVVYGFAHALESGHINMAEWCRTASGERFKPGSHFGLRAMDFAAISGQLDVVQWCHEQYPDECSVSAMNYAASKGNMEMLLWFHTNRSEGCTTRAMNEAAENGHLEIVQWLHANRTEGCTTAAMDKAAANNHLDVFHWLAENRTEGCSNSAMDGAASNGHLHVVQWLHEHRTEGCTTRAMDGAAAEGRLDIVQWLHEHRSEGCTTQAIDDAAGNGHLDVVKWLHEHRSEGFTDCAIRGAVSYGHMGIVLYLDSIGSPPYDECIVGAAQWCVEHMEIVQWLRRKYPAIKRRCHHYPRPYLTEMLRKHLHWSQWSDDDSDSEEE